MVGLLAAVLAIRSLGWPIQHDGPMVLYPSYLAWSGQKTPYRDLFDVNLPGSFLLYGLLGWITGLRDVALQVVDLALIGFLGWIVVKTSPKDRRAGTTLGFLSFVAYYLGWYDQFELQREFFLVILMVAAFGLAVEDDKGWKTALSIGLLAGLAATIKPPALLPFIWIFLARKSSSKNLPELGRSSGLFVAGFSIPVSLVVMYLVGVGALTDFLSMSRNYLPLYSMTNGWHHVMSPTEKKAYTMANVLPLNPEPQARWLLNVLFIASAVLEWRSPELRLRARLLAGILLCLLVLPAFSGQFFFYHFMPFMFFALVGLGTFLPLESMVGQRADIAKWLVAVPSCVAVGCALAMSYRTAVQPKPSKEETRVKVMTDYLRGHLRAGQSVQPLDWTAGSLHAMQNLRAPLATRFIYDFLLYQNVSNPYIQNLRRIFLTEFDRSNPQILLQVYSADKPWMTGPDTTRRFPALEQRLVQRYRVALQGNGFRIWEKKQ